MACTSPQHHVFHASTSVIPNGAARRAKELLAARRHDGELDKLVVDAVGDGIPVCQHTGTQSAPHWTVV